MTIGVSLTLRPLEGDRREMTEIVREGSWKLYLNV